MDPALLIPTPDSIPAHRAWFEFFLILTFMLHLLFMNTMVGSGIIAFFYALRRPSKPNLDALQKDIAQKLTFVIAFTINLGVAPLLFLQVLYGQFLYVSSLLMGVFWLSGVGLLIVAYYIAYLFKFRFDRLQHLRIYFLGATVLLLMTIGFLFTNNMTLMLSPSVWIQYFNNPHGTLLNLGDPTLWPRFFHFMTASVAIGGLFIALTWRRKERQGIPQASENIILGMKWFTGASIIQIALGIWFLFSLPASVRALFWGGSGLHTFVLITGFAGALIVIGCGHKHKVLPAAIVTLLTVLDMIILRDLVRSAYLQPYFRISDLKVIAQVSPLILFLVTLGIGLGAIVYILRLAFRAGNET